MAGKEKQSEPRMRMTLVEEPGRIPRLGMVPREEPVPVAPPAPAPQRAAPKKAPPKRVAQNSGGTNRRRFSKGGRVCKVY